MNETNQARAHCPITNRSVCQPEFNSFLMVAIAATQGVYSRTKVKKLKAEAGVIIVAKLVATAEEETCNKTERELKTASLAEKPQIKAVAKRQSVKPKGANIGEMKRPI